MSNKPRPRLGRPRKYAPGFKYLEDNVLYGPVDVAEALYQNGYFGEMEPSAWKIQKTKVRHALARWVVNQHFVDSEGTIKRKGQRPDPGWLGKTWKASADRPHEGG